MMRALVAVGLILVGTSAFGKGLTKLAPTERLSLLAGRLSIQMPPKARIEARSRSIMAAAEPTAEETRVVVEAGNEKLVLMTYELFAQAGADFEAAAKKDLHRFGNPAPTMAVEPLVLTNGGALRALSLTPASIDATKEAVLTLGLYVAQPDDTVQLLVFYFNPAAAKDAAGCAALAKKIAATVEAGKTTLPTRGGPRPLSDGLTVTLPVGYIATQQEGPDFAVHRIRKLSPLGDDAPVLGVYIGNHPAYHHTRLEGAPVKVQKRPGKLFGKPIAWDTWDKDGVSTREAIVALPAPSNLKIHVFFAGPSAAANDELERVAETLR